VEEVAAPQATVKLKARKSLDGNIIISDHQLMDVVLIPAKNKVLTIPHPGFGEEVYFKQKDFFNALYRRGIFSGPMEGGNLYGVFEAKLAISEEVSPVQVALLEIERYFKQEAVEEGFGEDFDEEIEDRFINPEDDKTTDLGEVEPEEETRNTHQTVRHQHSGGYVY
jgi:hypothetical protein